MRSRRFGAEALTAIAALTAALAAVSCVRWLGDAPPDARAARISSDLAECFARAPQAAKNWMSREATGGQELDETFACGDRALSLFAEKAEFSRPGVWSLSEVERFLVRSLRAGAPLQTQLLREAFLLKRAWIGGGESELTRGELERAKAIVRVARAQAKILAPYADVYAGRAALDSESGADRARFDGAAAALMSASAQIVGAFGEIGGGDHANFSIETGLRIVDEAWPGSDVARFKNLASAIKSILLAGSRSEIAPGEWAPAFASATRLFIAYLRTRSFLKGDSLLKPGALEELESVANAGFAELRAAIGRRGRDEIIDAREWKTALEAAAPLVTFPFGLRAEALEAVIDPLFKNMLRPPGGPTLGDRPLGLGPAQLARLRDVFRDWLGGQRWATQATLEKNASPEWLREQGASAAIERTRARFGDVAFDPPPSRRAALELAANFASVRPIAWQGRRVFVSRELTEQSARDLALTNLVRWAARWVIESYAGDRERARSAEGITDVETQAFYADVRPLGLALGWMDPRVRTSGLRSFSEATLFTGAGRGQALMSLAEGTDFFAMVISGGAAGDQLFSDAVRSCRAEGGADAFGRPRLAAVCFRAFTRQNFATYFGHLPGLVAEMRAADDLRWRQLFAGLENAVRPGGSTDDPIDAYETRAIVPLAQYAESLALKYDVAPPDGRVSIGEIRAAWPVFRRVIETMFAGKNFYYQLAARGIGAGASGIGECALIYLARDAMCVGDFDLGRADFAAAIGRLTAMKRTDRVNALDAWYDGLLPTDFFPPGVQRNLNRLPLISMEPRSRLLAAAAFQELQSDDPAKGLVFARLLGCPDESAAEALKIGRERAREIAYPRPEGASDGAEFGRAYARALRTVPELARSCLPPFN